MPPTDQEVVNIRTFATPRERVFAAFSQPAQLACWWGPEGFTNTIHEFDLRPQGMWRLTMHGPHGANYENTSRFLDVEPPARVVYEHLDPIHQFRMTMLFEAPTPETTTLTWRMDFGSPAEAAKLRTFIHAANEQNFDRLAAHLSISAN